MVLVRLQGMLDIIFKSIPIYNARQILHVNLDLQLDIHKYLMVTILDG